MRAMSVLFKELKEALAQLDESFEPVLKELKERLSRLQKSLRAKQSAHDNVISKILPGLDITRAQAESHVAQAMSVVEKKQAEVNGKKASLQQRIDEVKSAMAAKASVLNKLNEVLRDLEKQSRSLKKEIDERGVIANLWKWLFGDPERVRLSEVDEQIKQRCKEKKDVVTERDRIRTELQLKERVLDGCNVALRKADDELTVCADQLSWLKELKRSEDEIEYLKVQIVTCEHRLTQTEISIRDKKNAALLKLDSLCKEMRLAQPQIANLSPSDYGKSEKSCDMMAFGRLRLSQREEKIGYVPRLLPFPLKSALSFEASARGRQWIVDFLLRVFQDLPLSQISITAIDPLELGKSLQECQLLLRNKHPFPAQRILTRGDEIESALSALLCYVENLIQSVFVAGIACWSDYNQKNEKNPLPYKLLVMFDLPEQLSDKSALYLSRLVEHGPKCGVLPLIAYDAEKLGERKYASLRETLSTRTWWNGAIYRHSSMTAHWKNLRFSEEPELQMTEARLHEVMASLEEKFRTAGKFAGTMEDLWCSSVLWSQSAADGVEAEVGWTAEGNEPVSFKLGDDPAHALLGGSTGSGKSNFLHVLVQSLCHRYSPEELNLYLLDYKDGVEFNCYANPTLPHARLVAIESDVEYGLTVLRHLCDEHHRRSALFKRFNVRDYRSYRRQGLDRLPRIVVIIDEFQRLFEASRTFAEGADSLLKTLLKQGRSSGIHLILATQTVRGLSTQTVGSLGELLNNIGCRMALSCPAEDSEVLLGRGNAEAETLQKQRDGIINLKNGLKSANVRFCIPYADENVRRRELDMLVQRSKTSGLSCPHAVFRGNALPLLPTSDEFRKAVSTTGIGLLLGLMHDFDAKPFVVDVGQGGVLIAGFDPVIRNGLLSSVVASLRAQEDCKVIYYSSKCDVKIDRPAMPEDFILKDADWDFADLDALVNENPNTFLIVDTYDYARRLSPPVMGSYRRPGTPETPWEVLKRIADPFSTVHARVVLFVENYHRFANSAKELFNLFDLRIGFGLDEDEAGSLVSSGSIAKLKGLQGLTKAVFVDRTKGGVAQFVRPFVDPPLTDRSGIGG